MICPHAFLGQILFKIEDFLEKMHKKWIILDDGTLQKIVVTKSFGNFWKFPYLCSEISKQFFINLYKGYYS